MAKWTKEPPTTTGFYWHRQDERDSNPEILELHDHQFWRGDSPSPIDPELVDIEIMKAFFGEFWDEPIQPPPSTLPPPAIN
jgi:hypothetical protein